MTEEIINQTFKTVMPKNKQKKQCPKTPYTISKCTVYLNMKKKKQMETLRLKSPENLYPYFKVDEDV